MKKVQIPTCMSPFIVDVNGKRYIYPAGTEQEVPDEVAIIIENHNKGHEAKHAPTEPPFESGPSSGGVSSWNEIANTGATSVFDDSIGVYAFQVYWDCLKMFDVIPETFSIKYDGTLFENLNTVSIPDVGNFVGNMYYLNSLYGTSFPNTGEPFLANVFKGNLYIMTLDTTATKHFVRVSAYCKPLTTLPTIDLMKYIENITDGNEKVLSGDTLAEDYRKLANNDTVLLKLCVGGDMQAVVVHPIVTDSMTVSVRCFVSVSNGTVYHVLQINAFSEENCTLHVHEMNGIYKEKF